MTSPVRENLQLSTDDDFWLKVLLGCYFIIFTVLAFFSDGTYETGDSTAHYLISRYSFQHPDLFLHLWGKPLFTLLSSPFSQSGFIGIKIFNILCGVAAIYFTVKICQLLQVKNSLMIFAFILLTPVYARCLLSGLTEPFFSAFLVISIYLYLKNKYLWGTLLFSFLPLIRTEGIFLLAIPFLYLLVQRQFLFIPLLITGWFIYSAIGFFVFKDFFWMITQNPYKGAKEVYGHGGVLHFVKHYNDIWGLAVTVFLILGLVAFTVNFYKHISDALKANFNLVFIYSFFVLFFLAHTFFWWKGLFGSIGTIRVIAAVIPVTSIICLQGLNFIIRKVSIKFNSIVVAVSVIFILAWFVGKDIVPVHLNTEDKVIKQTADWIRQSKLEEHKLYYLSPYFSLFLDRDIYDNTKNEEPWAINDKYYVDGIPQGSLLIWDSHFAANEGRISLTTLIANENFKVLNKFRSEKLWIDLNKEKKYFEIYVFQKK
jgi:hypothetical protein